MVLNITVCMCNLDNCWTKDTKKPKNPTTKKPGCQEQKQSTAHASCMQHHQFSSVHLFSQVWLFATPWTAARQASLSITNSRSLLKLMSISLVMPSNHLILCRPLLLLPSIFPGIRVFSSESALHIRWPKYWSFSFGISPSNEYSGLISFRIDWFDLLADHGTLKSLLQHHSQKASNRRSSSEPSGKPVPSLSCMQTLSCSMWDLFPD